MLALRPDVYAVFCVLMAASHQMMLVRSCGWPRAAQSLHARACLPCCCMWLLQHLSIGTSEPKAADRLQVLLNPLHDPDDKIRPHDRAPFHQAVLAAARKHHVA